MPSKPTVGWQSNPVFGTEQRMMHANTAMDVLVVLLLCLLALPLILAACLRCPEAATLGLIAILCLFSSSTWGQLQEENTLYSRGTGIFHFSLLNLLLWIATAAACMRHLYRNGSPRRLVQPGRRPPFPVFFAAFAFLMVAHVVLGLMAGKELLLILGYTGLINVLNLLLFAWLITQTLAEPAAQQRLLQLLLTLAGVRAVFGLVRYQWLGGDSANPYRNFEGLDIQLVYFDICDNFIAALAAFILAWLLLMPRVKLSFPKRVLLLLWLTMEIATVALSFRRSSLIGLALMSLVLFWKLPWRRRLLLAVTGSFGMMISALVLMKERLQFNTSGSDGLVSSLLYDVGPNHATDVSRFYELEAVAKSLDGHWLFGLGSWGSFRGDEDILDYHFGQFDFVHSGFGHLVLKSGLAGLLIFIALLIAFGTRYLRERRYWQGQSALMADAAMAGLLFWMPTLLIGTPIIEFRTMLLLGLTLALPYLCLPRAGSGAVMQRRSHVAA